MSSRIQHLTFLLGALVALLVALEAPAQLAGEKDDFADPDDPSTPSVGMTNWLNPSIMKDFDDTTRDRHVAHRFSGLSNIVAATLEVRVRPSGGATNDSIVLEFVNSSAGHSGGQNNRWGRRFSDLTGETWSSSNANVSGGVTITLDLLNLPADADGTTEMVSHIIAAGGILDVRVQDDTVVDYYELTTVTNDLMGQVEVDNWFRLYTGTPTPNLVDMPLTLQENTSAETGPFYGPHGAAAIQDFDFSLSAQDSYAYFVAWNDGSSQAAVSSVLEINPGAFDVSSGSAWQVCATEDDYGTDAGTSPVPGNNPGQSTPPLIDITQDIALCNAGVGGMNSGTNGWEGAGNGLVTTDVVNLSAMDLPAGTQAMWRNGFGLGDQGDYQIFRKGLPVCATVSTSCQGTTITPGVFSCACGNQWAIAQNFPAGSSCGDIGSAVITQLSTDADFLASGCTAGVGPMGGLEIDCGSSPGLEPVKIDFDGDDRDPQSLDYAVVNGLHIVPEPTTGLALPLAALFLGGLARRTSRDHGVS